MNSYKSKDAEIADLRARIENLTSKECAEDCARAVGEQMGLRIERGVIPIIETVLRRRGGIDD